MTVNERSRLLNIDKNRKEDDYSINTSTKKYNAQKDKKTLKDGIQLHKTSDRKRLFEYPALPEIKICFIVVLFAIIYAWYCVYNASQKWSKRIGKHPSLRPLPFFGVLRYKDEINWEWLRWSPFALTYLKYYFSHSVIFNYSEKFFAEQYGVLIYICFSVLVSAQMFTAKLVAFTIVQGIFIFLCTYYSRRQITVWLSSLPSLYLVMNHSALLSTDVFHVLLFVSYTLLSYISFCLDWTAGKTRSQDKTAFQLLRRMFYYTFYQPYLFSLIVVYSDFERQIEQRKNVQSNFKAIAWRAIRVAFWWFVLESMLYFFYFESMLHDTDFSFMLPKNEFVTLGMALGAFFHMKYAVIFGLPAVFALIDGMEPPAGPICISRVALYSKIWRGFDRGLYAFFKTYIFMPICAPTFSSLRRILGVLISYLFVLIWHGFHHQNIVWIALNIAELFIEYGSKGIYSYSAVRNWRERTLSDTNFRRLLGWAQILPFAFGLYSNFYFLGGSHVGWMFVQRIFIEETVTLRWPFFLLIFIGYFFMQIAMEFERYFSQQDSKATSQKKQMSTIDKKTK